MSTLDLLQQVRAEALDWTPKDVRVATSEEAEARAAAEVAAHVGRFLRVSAVFTHVQGAHPTLRSDGDIGPAIVRVVPLQDPDAVAHWNEDFLDPYWAVEVIDHPRKEEIEGAWIWGRSYFLDESMTPVEQLVEGFCAPGDVP